MIYLYQMISEMKTLNDVFIGGRSVWVWVILVNVTACSWVLWLTVPEKTHCQKKRIYNKTVASNMVCNWRILLATSWIKTMNPIHDVSVPFTAHFINFYNVPVHSTQEMVPNTDSQHSIYVLSKYVVMTSFCWTHALKFDHAKRKLQKHHH